MLTKKLAKKIGVSMVSEKLYLDDIWLLQLVFDFVFHPFDDFHILFSYCHL